MINVILNIEYSELSMSQLLKDSTDDSAKVDVYCFGLSLLEMISSDVSGTHAFKVLTKIINKGEKQEILSSIIDDKLRDIIAKSLEEDPDCRASID
jgi:serine/threonine protein kinase